jgi:hypothetical protein
MVVQLAAPERVAALAVDHEARVWWIGREGTGRDACPEEERQAQGRGGG